MSPERLVADAERTLRVPHVNGKPAAPRQQFALTALSDLMAEPPEAIAYVLDKTLPRGGASLMSAKPKAGKSTAARALAVSVAKGIPFLGRATTQGPVVYLALEEKRSEVTSHFRRMGATGPIHVHTGPSPEAAMEALAAVVHDVKPALVIIDTLLKLIRLRDVNDYAEVNRQMEPLLNLARSTDTHLLALHHSGKGDRAGGDVVLGSTALFGAVDSLLVMRRGKDNIRTIEAIVRYGEDLPETVLAMDAETGAVAVGGTVEQMLMDQAKAQVMAEMSETEEFTEPEIRDRVGGNTGLVGKAIRRLAADRLILRCGNGKRGDPYRYRKPTALEACPL